MITPAFIVERQAAALARAQRHWQEEHEQPDKARGTGRAWTIALTREAGARGALVAQEIGRRMNWPVYDRELVERIAREMGLRTSLLESVDERHKSWLLEGLEGLTIAGPVTETKFVKHLAETVLSLSALGHCVIVGRGAAHLLPMESTLRVRLVGPKDDRVQATMAQLHLAADQALAWVEQTDRDRARFVKDHFGKDPSDPSHYDLVLNSTRWTTEECADLIIAALKKLPVPK